jgi:hypothetical protein
VDGLDAVLSVVVVGAGGGMRVRAGGSSRLRLALVKGVLVRRLAVNLTRGVGMLSLELRTVRLLACVRQKGQLSQDEALWQMR